MLRNCEAIYAKQPDFVVYGRSGFKGYVVFGFTRRNLYILEGVVPNNTTYVSENDWEEISQLSKAEAIAIAREISINSNSELFIHGTDGRIREKNSYGNDSYPPKG